MRGCGAGAAGRHRRRVGAWPLLTVALAYSAARGIARLREAESPRLAWTLALGCSVALFFAAGW